MKYLWIALMLFSLGLSGQKNRDTVYKSDKSIVVGKIRTIDWKGVFIKPVGGNYAMIPLAEISVYSWRGVRKPVSIEQSSFKKDSIGVEEQVFQLRERVSKSGDKMFTGMILSIAGIAASASGAAAVSTDPGFGIAVIASGSALSIIGCIFHLSGAKDLSNAGKP